MFELYATWVTLPALISNGGRRLAVRRAVLWLSVLLVAAISAMQDAVTNKDREVYAFLIDSIKDDGAFSMEPGFYLLVRLLGLWLAGPELRTAFFFVVAAISMMIKLRLFSSYGGSMFGCLAAFFSYFFLVHEITQVRTGVAIGLLYLSWFAFAEGRKREYWLYGLAASMFHLSCVLFLLGPVLFSPDNRMRWALSLSVTTLLAATSVLAGSATLSILDAIAQTVGIERLGLYLALLDDGILSEISAIRLVPHALLLAAVALIWNRWKRDRLTLFVVQIYLYGLVVFILLSPIPALAYRISDLFLFASVFVIGRMRYYVHKNLYYPLVVAYTGVFLVYTIQFSGLFLTGDGN